MDKFSWSLLGVLLLLLPFNLGLEINKVLNCLKFAKVDLDSKAVQLGISRGLALRFGLPNKMGLAASVLWAAGRKQSVSLILPLALNNISQMFMTLLFGAVSLVIYWKDISLGNWKWNGLAFGMIIGALVLIWMAKRKWEIFNQPINASLVILLGRDSLLRYAIFTFQFAFAAHYFCPELSLVDHLQIIPLVFLVSTIIPIGFAGNVGVREGVAVGVYAMLGFENEGLILASLIVWLVNLLLPAIMGFLIYLLNKSTVKK
ncbi:lysylphosphatidylglycerol synthase transmembrane domain-containing protein [Luteibaculum oceani]|uniref:Flippase-like domain-containing protein n=1 Tax=Luteibaculum oceani TaxID=1294296 RepID=A0A5C6V4U5_9FLAO|nr:hypothetical protein [Luteibaculum oceani]TXC78798.1 hypothetical protein FRX97_06180 [Luteibaculum oceani]